MARSFSCTESAVSRSSSRPTTAWYAEDLFLGGEDLVEHVGVADGLLDDRGLLVRCGGKGLAHGVHDGGGELLGPQPPDAVGESDVLHAAARPGDDGDRPVRGFTGRCRVRRSVRTVRPRPR